MKRFLTILFLALPLAGQSPVIRQGTTPTGAVDFSGAATTKPLRIGVALPGTCTAGELFFLTNVGVYECVNGTFTALGSGGTWGTIGGPITAQPDLWNELQGKQTVIATGTQAQYLRGDGSLSTFPATMPPTPHAAAHGILGTDPVALAASQIAGLAASATSDATKAQNINYVQGSAGSVQRTVASKLAEAVSVLDFGADPTGTNDSTAAIQAAINYAASSAVGNVPGGKVIIPKGEYIVSERTTTISDASTGAGTTGAATIQLKHKVDVECDGATIAGTGSFTDAMIKAYTRDDNNASSFIITSMTGCQLTLNSSSNVAILDTSGMRNSLFSHIGINGTSTTSQIGINISDRTPGNYQKSDFFNTYEKFYGTGPLGTAIRWVTIDGNASFQTLADFQLGAGVAVFDTTGTVASQGGILRNSYFTAGTATTALFKGSPPQGLTILYSGCEGCASNFPADWGQVGAVAPFLVVPPGGFNSWSNTYGPPGAYIGGLQLGRYSFLGVNGQTPLLASDLSPAFVLTGCQILANVNTQFVLPSPCVLYNGYRMEWQGATLWVTSSTPAGSETDAVPGSPYKITVQNTGIVSGDSGVKYATTGSPLTKVASNPATGQYAVSAGVYTFSAGDNGAQVSISYTYGPHTETIYADQTTSSYAGDRIHSSVNGTPAGGLALATASVDGTGNILSVTDARVFNPTLTLQGLELPSLKAGSGLNNACFDTNGNLTSQSSACSGVSTSSVGLSLPADLSASSPTIPSSGTLTITRNSQNAHTFLAGPASGTPTPPLYRALVSADLPPGYPYSSLSGAPTIPNTAAQVGALADPGSGTTILKRVSANTVAAATAADLTGLLGYTPLNPASAQNQNTVYAGPASGGNGAPSFRPLASADIPNNAANTTGNAASATALAGTPTPCTAGSYALGITANGNATGCTPANTGTVTHSAGALTSTYVLMGNGGADAMASAAYLDGSSILNNPAGFKSGGAGSGFVQLGGATSGTVTVTAQAAAGTWTLTLPNSAGTNGYALTTDGNGNMSWAAIPAALPPNGPAGGDLSGSYPNPTVAQINGAALPAVGSLTKTNGSGQLVAAVAGTDYVLPTGSIAGNAATATALASAPTTCTAGNYPLGITANGNATGCTAATGGGGTVTSVTFTGDGTLLSATPSTAVTSSGTVAASLKTQTKNTVLAGPSSGAAANPTFRVLAAADLPTQTLNYWVPGTIQPPTQGALATLGGTGLANTVRFVIFTLPFNTSISKASFYIGTIDAGQTADFGLYNAAGSSKLWSIGAGSGISLGGSPIVVSATNTTVTLAAGSYLFAWTESGTVGQVYGWNMSQYLYLLLVSGSSYKYGTCTNTATAGVLPTTCGTPIAATSAFNVPVVMLEP
jgi:hypothetical protein